MRIASFVLALALLMPLPASAQESPLTLKSLEVDLWPEYDRPTMLVIYNATLPPEAKLPVQISIRIPAAAGKPNGVAYPVENQSKPLTLPYTRQVQGEWASITFTAITPQFLIEYYDPSLSKQAEARHYVYRWPGDYALSSMTVRVQQPVGATDMRFSPSIPAGPTDAQGITYYVKDVGALPAGQSFDITIDYNKNTDSLSVESLQVQPSQPITAATTGRINFRNAIPWALGVLGILLILGGGWWYLQFGRGETAELGHRRRKPAAERAEPVVAGSEIYCHQCGKRAAPNDRFCRSCGARLRTDS